MTETFDRVWLYQKIVEESPIAILYADREGNIRLWNSGAEAMFGYSAEEAVGKSMELIIPQNLCGRHWEGWDRVMASGVTKYGRDALAVPAIRKDGSRISIEFNILLLRAPTEEIVGAVATILDVTARFQQQKELRSRLAALEAKVKESGGTV
jgi:PAS domain S-box-containing protein